jgi:hypothetical protein
VISAVDIARHAREADAGLSDALHLIGQHSHYRYAKSGRQDDAVSDFITELCLKAGCSTVLEYTAADALLTASLAEKRPSTRLTYVARNTDFVEALRLITAGEMTVTSDVASLPKGIMMDAVICSPALGHRPSGQVGDGFGSEVSGNCSPS